AGAAGEVGDEEVEDAALGGREGAACGVPAGGDRVVGGAVEGAAHAARNLDAATPLHTAETPPGDYAFAVGCGRTLVVLARAAHLQPVPERLVELQNVT